MKGHDVAIKLIEDWAADNEHPLTESYIKNLNQVILKEPFWKEAITADGQNTRRLIKVGNYKEFPNSVRLQNGVLFNYASPAETPIQMDELLNWYRSEEATLHPVTLAAMLHYKFVRIHPFDDGNGRIARLLMNYVLLKNNLPPIIIKAKDKQNYLRALHLADIGNYEPFIYYIAEQLVWSLEIFISSAMGENIEEFEDLDKELYVLQQELKNENVLKTSANTEIICDTIEENIIPLFILTEEKLEALKEYFFDFNRRIEYEFDGQNGTFMVGTKDTTWEQLKENWLTKQIRAEMKKDFELYKYIRSDYFPHTLNPVLLIHQKQILINLLN
jgi:fido (protein-threonine AMPylation protein)/rubredoxin